MAAEQRVRPTNLPSLPALVLVLIGLLLLALGPPVFADEDEAAAELERQQAFRDGMAEIVEDLNRGSYERFVRAIDEDVLLERILGLRLIDQKIQRQFAERFDASLEPMVRQSIYDRQGDIRAALIRVVSRGDQGLAVVRYDLPNLQFEYHEFELKLDRRGRLTILDWTSFLDGERISDAIGIGLVMAAPRSSAVRKLVDEQIRSEAMLFQLTELLKAARDRKDERYFEILEGLDASFRRERIVVLTSVQLAKAVRKRRLLRPALIEMDRHFGEEPLYAIMLLDLYFPTRQYQKAYDALLRLEQRIGAEDAGMKARLSAAALVLERHEDAVNYAARAIELDPAVELGWWSALRAAALTGNFSAAVAALGRLEGEFGHELGPDALQKDPAFRALVTSDEYQSWLKDR